MLTIDVRVIATLIFIGIMIYCAIRDEGNFDFMGMFIFFVDVVGYLIFWIIYLATTRGVSVWY